MKERMVKIMNHDSMSRFFVRVVLCLALGQSASWTSDQELPPSRSPSFQVEDLGTLPGDNYSVAYNVNNLGEVVGVSGNDRDPAYGHGVRAFLYREGRMIDLGTLGGVGSQAFNLNDNGQIVGRTYQADGRAIPFLYSNGQMTNLEALTGVGSTWQLTPSAINNAGQIVGGAYEWQSGTEAPFYYTAGQFLLFTNHPPGIYPSGAAADINESGLACGGSDLGMSRYVAVYISEMGVMPIPPVQAIPGETYGFAINNAGHLLGGLGGDNFIYHDGELTFLGPFREGYVGYAHNLNDSDDVIGDNATSDPFPFLYREGVVYYLNDHIRPHSGWALQGAYGLNNKAQIVGFGLHHGKRRAYLLTPTDK